MDIIQIANEVSGEPILYRSVTAQDGIAILVRYKGIRKDLDALKPYGFLISTKCLDVKMLNAASREQILKHDLNQVSC